MLLDALDLADGTTLDADLCIVGGGMAGLALAQEFRERALAVVVLEGGGEAPEPDSQALYGGKARLHDGAGGTVDLGGFLAESRLRCLGGSGNVWGAKCALLDESDFLARAWMPGSGWPFSRAELMPFYDRACERLRIRRFDYEPRGEFDPGRPELALDGYVTATRHLSPVRGGPGTTLAEYKQAVTGAANVRVVLHSNVLAVETDERAARVVAVRASTLRGNGFRVRARAFVLAAGGIENARLLLVSRCAAAPRGLGNAHDLVGRNFANHATFGPGAALGFTQALESLDLYTTRDPARICGASWPSDARPRSARSARTSRSRWGRARGPLRPRTASSSRSRPWRTRATSRATKLAASHRPRPCPPTSCSSSATTPRAG